MNAKNIANYLVESRLGRGLLRSGEALTKTKSDQFRALTYHRVPNPQVFTKQLEFLSKNHSIIGIQDVLDAFQDNSPLPSNSVLLTFDDAYDCFEQNAWPELKSRNLPALLFVPTAFPDAQRPFWWDVLGISVQSTSEPTLVFDGATYRLDSSRSKKASLKRLLERFKSIHPNDVDSRAHEIIASLRGSPVKSEIIGWEGLRNLAREGVSIAPHTANHPILTQLEDHEIEREIKTAIDDIKRETGQSWPVLAYPAGYHSEKVTGATRDAGIKLAFTTRRGTNTIGRTDPLRIKRLNVGTHATVSTLRALLLEGSETWPFSILKRRRKPPPR